eukprot:2531037-Alexandrium_andersonii.AAC.1
MTIGSCTRGPRGSAHVHRTGRKGKLLGLHGSRATLWYVHAPPSGDRQWLCVHIPRRFHCSLS